MFDDKVGGRAIEVKGGLLGHDERRTSRPAARRVIRPEALGSTRFRRDYGIRYAYVAGGMYKGIASKELVVAMARSGLLAYFGSGGLETPEIEAAIRSIQSQLDTGQTYGVNFLRTPDRPEHELRLVDLFLALGVRNIEAAGFTNVTPSLVAFRLKGVKRAPDGAVEVPNRCLAKVSRLEVGARFMEPAPVEMVRQLVATGRLSASEADLGATVSMADEVCAEADSGGHTDGGSALALVPAMLSLRNESMEKYRYHKVIVVGAAGGIGTPAAAAAAFTMGADFVLTGSVNQCTAEAGTSASVKDLLQEIGIHDTGYAPAGDMFELGAKVQVVKKGVFFPARANKLYELYLCRNSLDDIDPKTRAQLETKYFGRSFAEVWEETKGYYRRVSPKVIEAAEERPKQKMALVFKWYFMHSGQLAIQGARDQLDYQIPCGPALGAFNNWVKGTPLESWRNRHTADIAERIMKGAAELLTSRLSELTGAYSPGRPGSECVE